MSKNTTKTVVGFVANFSASATVGLALRTILPPQLTLLERVCTGVGAFALGGVAGRAAEDFAHDFVDDTYSIFNK